MGGLLRWAIQEAVYRNKFKVYSNESNGTDEGAADLPKAGVYDAVG